MTSPSDPGSATVEAVWEDLLADLAATADQYREDGWDTLELHPGDVTVVTGNYGDRVGLDVLVPDDEYRDLESWFDDGLTVDGYDVYRSTADPVVLLVVVVRDESARRAVLYPLVYSTADDQATALFETAADRGVVNTYLRRLSGDYVELRHENPNLLAPPSDDDAREDS